MNVLQAGRALTPHGVVTDAEISIDERGRIVAVSGGRPGANAGLWAVPGFVDTHCHGAVGVSFGHPDRGENLRAIAFHRAHGSTTLFASTVTEPVEKLEAQLRSLAELVADDELAGIHLEGPCLAERRKGAHDAALLRDPEPDLVDRLLAAGGPALRMITLAVEREHGQAATRRFVEAGVRVALGHSDADEPTALASLDWGVDVVTHLFNAMRPVHHRDPGPIPVLLTDERCTVELICDGIHLAASVARMAIEAAGPERVAMVTDAMSATGQADGRYILGELDVVVTDGAARLVTADGSLGALAGSTLTMDRAFSFLVGQVGCSVPEAAVMCATTPARRHGLVDVGELAPGRLADVCLVDDAGVLQQVHRRGCPVPLAGP